MVVYELLISLIKFYDGYENDVQNHALLWFFLTLTMIMDGLNFGTGIMCGIITMVYNVKNHRYDFD